MSLGNGNPKEGDKGSNFNYELKVLQGLEAIALALESNPVIFPNYKVYEAIVSYDTEGGTFDINEKSNTIGTADWTRQNTGEYTLKFLEGDGTGIFLDNTRAAVLYNPNYLEYSINSPVATAFVHGGYVTVTTYPFTVDVPLPPVDALEYFYIQVKFFNE